MAAQSRYMDDFNVAGMRYWDGATVLDKLKPGKKLRLVAEPRNRHDPNAVAIYRKDVKIGYVPRANNAMIAQLLRFGHHDVVECRILKVDSKADTWNRCASGCTWWTRWRKTAAPRIRGNTGRMGGLG